MESGKSGDVGSSSSHPRAGRGRKSEYAHARNEDHSRVGPNSGDPPIRTLGYLVGLLKMNK